jgi:plasmid stabilization system protein ParE
VTDSSSLDDPGPLLVYAIRLLPRAISDIDDAVIWLEEQAGSEISKIWREGLKTALKRLSSPREHSIIPEHKHFRREVRQLIYRRTPSSVAYRILFLVSDDTPDGPLVLIFHIRHSARRPITIREARQMRSEI